MKTALRLLAFVALASSLACAAPPPAAPAGPTDADRAAVEANPGKYEAAYNAGDAAAVAQLVAESYEGIQPDGTRVQGRMAYEEGLSAQFATAKAAGLTIALTITPGYTNWIDATHAVAGGTFSLAGVAPGQPSSGSYLSVTTKEADGMWRISNSLVAYPVPPPAAPAAN